MEFFGSSKNVPVLYSCSQYSIARLNFIQACKSAGNDYYSAISRMINPFRKGAVKITVAQKPKVMQRSLSAGDF
jgi:hypothetical protein